MKTFNYKINDEKHLYQYQDDADLELFYESDAEELAKCIAKHHNSIYHTFNHNHSINITIINDDYSRTFCVEQINEEDYEVNEI